LDIERYIKRKPEVNRRGRVRIAIPKFDFESFLVGISAE